MSKKFLYEFTLGFLLDVIWGNELEPELRVLGIRTDKDVEGPRRSNF